MKRIKNIRGVILDKFFLLLVAAVVSFTSNAQDDKTEGYQNKLNELSGNKKLEYYREITSDLLSHSPIWADKFLLDAIKEAESQKDTIKLIEFHRIMGAVKGRLNQFDLSSKYYNKAVDLSKQSNNELELNKSRINMSMVYLYNRQYDEGIQNLKRCIKKLEGTREKETLGKAYSNLANMYREKGELEASLPFYHKAKEIQVSIGDDENLATTYANIGSVLSLLQRFEEALEFLDKASKIVSKNKTSLKMGFIYLEYSRVHQKREEYSQADAFATLALEIASKAGDLNQKSAAYNQLGLIAYQQRDFESSLNYLVNQMNIDDSLNKQLQASRVRETSAIYGVFEAESKAIELKHQVAQEKSRFQIILSITIGVSLLLILSFIMWIRIRAKNRFLFEQSLKSISPVKQSSDLEPEEEEKYKQLYEQILKEFEEKKVYLDSNLTMGGLSDIVSSNSNYVSKSINIYFGSNFNSMINFYRVNEAKRLIEGGALETYTMETVASNCGFTSLSVFNRSFKKETGITPTFFNKSLTPSNK